MGMKWAQGRTFTQKTCDMLARVFDMDRNGTISFNEFAQLYQFVSNMQISFSAFDRDGSGKLDINEVGQALSHGGFNFGTNTVEQVLKKFGHAYEKGYYIDFDSFIQLCAFMGQVRSLFEVHDVRRTGTIQVTMEQLVHIATGF